MLGHITYLSDDLLSEKFGRELKRDEYGFNYDVEFEIESYLRYQGDKFAQVFDANTYLHHDQGARLLRPGEGNRRRPREGARAGEGRASSSPPSRATGASRRRARARSCARWSPASKRVTYAEIDAPHGHDAFLLDDAHYHQLVAAYMDNIAAEIGAGSRARRRS